MIKRKTRQAEEVNASSMADIAFLLLIFFLVTTTIVSEKGVNFILPPKKEKDVEIKLHDRNIFKVLVNSNDQLLIEDQFAKLDDVRSLAMEFITKGADSPQDAIISYKTDRGTSYEMYISVLNELKAAYHQLRADQMGVTKTMYLKYDEGSKSMSKTVKATYDTSKKSFPMQLSRAEPSDIGTY
ncbi:MAG: ExbD/TolR family protein [Cyclobacteriaceae bacterium]